MKCEAAPTGRAAQESTYRDSYVTYSYLMGEYDPATIRTVNDRV